MSALITKYAVYFPKFYGWLTTSSTEEQQDITRDIQKAMIFDSTQQAEATLVKFGIKEALIQRYKASLVIADAVTWKNPVQQ